MPAPRRSASGFKNDVTRWREGRQRQLSAPEADLLSAHRVHRFGFDAISHYAQYPDARRLQRTRETLGLRDDHGFVE